jgi:hypothetical protein
VGELAPGRVTLKLSQAEAEQLGPYEEPAPEVVILPEKTSWWSRFLDRIGWKR